MKLSNFTLPGVLALALLAPPAAIAAPELAARDIMEKNFFASKLKGLKTDLSMVLINDKGQTRERNSYTIQKLQANGVDSNLLVRFSFPNDIKGTGFLQIEHSDGDDDQWIYLPALKKTRRLVANNKKDSFVGSDFSYGDISLPKVDLYRHALLRSEPLDKHDCYVIESVPANESVSANSGYSKKKTWVRKDDAIEAKVEYYDLSGRLLKTQTTADHLLVEPSPQRWFAKQREMTNHQTGHKTVLKFEKVEAGVAIGDGQFTPRYLESE
ncbi:MAG: outer membrane lipoprotein-sorting protein [Pseudomonadota bacterium]